ncbi:hypothetical protein PVL29_001849 [Vitis rotundifolia]|uniref:ATP-dependent RNA helicase n=1 Tax=Vitis rotundifolia TaxID=103349 RepID=A0AA39AHM9_VITRO|nr:hypothetical protein PVL29_001849 [Vitis rotundifolia]
MYSSILRRHSSSSSKLLCAFFFARPMGGGPRTFPGGINKWQWKRLHEKKAREKEKRLLDHEKQLYEARIRSQIRAKLAGKPVSEFSPDSDHPNHNPMSPQDHIKALADRFMKEGAEDLWNDDDGPVKSPPPLPRRPSNGLSRQIEPPVDLRKLTSHGWSLGPGNARIVSRALKPRHYSEQVRRRFRRNESSSSDDDSGVSSGDEFSGTLVDDDVELRGRRNVQKMMSSAALGKYDVKIKRRVMPKSIDEGDDCSEQIELIRHELSRKNLAKEEEKEGEESILSQKRFDECGVSPLTVKALSSAGYVQMTRVQEATLDVCLEGKDALVKAKTGTGKSAAFLLPAIEAVLKATSSNRIQRVPPILVLILCPTREIASQIAAETNVMLKYHDGIGVQTLIGGTRFKFDQKRLESDPCQIIVATPGRLLDHIENKGSFSVRLMGLKMLVLDEADHLLDLGFRKDMEKIVDCLPRQRQSLLFSATVPKEVRRISQLVLKREHAFVDTVGLGNAETHAQVRQSYLVAPHKLHFQIVYHLLKDHILQVPDYKVQCCSFGISFS